MPLRGRTDVHSANDLDTWKLRRSTNQVLVTRDGQSSDHGTSMVAFECWRASRCSLADTLPAVLPDALPSSVPLPGPPASTSTPHKLVAEEAD